MVQVHSRPLCPPRAMVPRGYMEPNISSDASARCRCLRPLSTSCCRYSRFCLTSADFHSLFIALMLNVALVCLTNAVKHTACSFARCFLSHYFESRLDTIFSYPFGLVSPVGRKIPWFHRWTPFFRCCRTRAVAANHAVCSGRPCAGGASICGTAPTAADHALRQSCAETATEEGSARCQINQ